MVAKKTVKIPDSVRMIVDRATMLFEQGRVDGAEVLLRTLPEDTPLRPMVLHLRGLIAMKMGRREHAQAFLKEAILLNPSDGEAHANLGVLMLELSRHGEAAAAFAAALTSEPQRATWHLGLAQSFAGAGHPDLAVEAFRDTTAIDGQFVQGSIDEALQLQISGAHAQAIERLQTLIAAHPERQDLHLAMAGSYAASDDWPSAWRAYAAAFGADQARAPDTAFDGAKLHVEAGDSIADILFLARFLPALKARGADVHLRAPQALKDLLGPILSDGQFLGPSDPGPEHAIKVSLFAVSCLFNAQPAPAEPHPYLFADPASAARRRADLGSHEGLTVGIASILAGVIDLGFFGPLLDCPGARFLALGADAARARRQDARLLALDPPPQSLSDLAAVIETLDLVITGDGALAHLAGALGRPVWIVLPLPADWRWLASDGDAMWYPQARLFRQTRSAHWEDAVLRLGDALWEKAGATDAFQGLDRASALNPISPVLAEALFMDGSRLLNAGYPARAKLRYERALTIDPDHVATLCNLGALLLRYGWLSEARPFLERAFALAPNNLDARLPLADALFALGERETAMGHYRALVASAPKNDRVRLSLGLALSKFEQHEEAVMHLEAALKINRNQSAYVFAELAKSLKARGNVEGARMALDHAVKLQPGYIEAHCQLGDLHLAAGRRVEAAASFMRALAVDANHEVAKDGLAKAQRRAAVVAEA